MKKDVLGYEGVYQVCSDNLAVINKITGRILKGGFCGVTKRRYKSVRLSAGGMAKTFYVHRLLAISFIPNPENKPCINHINGIREDNRLYNLEWCTQKENIRHAWDNNLCTPHGADNGKGQARACIINGIEYVSLTEAAAALRIDRAAVSRYVSGKKTCKKYTIG